jgi:hypothetical protein
MKFLFPLVLLLLLASCSGRQHLPALTGLAAGDATQSRPILQQCGQVFPRGDWQFVHSIEFNRSGRGGGSVIGVTTMRGKTLHCVLMTVEGLVLFEAELDQEELETRRVIPPFDTPEFARGLMRDVQTIFQPPPGQQAKTGRLEGGDIVCRYPTENGQITDVIIAGNDGFRINVYDADLSCSRAIVAGAITPEAAAMIPETLELTAFDVSSYTLKMTLISADKI